MLAPAGAGQLEFTRWQRGGAGGAGLRYNRVMKKLELKEEALRLPAEDRRELAESLWESLEDEEDSSSLPEWQAALLDERLAEDEAQPESGAPWTEVKARILART